MAHDPGIRDALAFAEQRLKGAGWLSLSASGGGWRPGVPVLWMGFVRSWLQRQGGFWADYLIGQTHILSADVNLVTIAAAFFGAHHHF